MGENGSQKLVLIQKSNERIKVVVLEVLFFFSPFSSTNLEAIYSLPYLLVVKMAFPRIKNVYFLAAIATVGGML